MKFIERFFKHELAIDLGTVNTLIYDPERYCVERAFRRCD